MLSTQFYNQRVDIVNTELFTLFEQNEPQIYEFMTTNQTDKDFNTLIETLYLDQRFVSRKINDNRLLMLCLEFLEQKIASKDHQFLGLNQELAYQRIPWVDRLMRKLVRSQHPKCQAIASQFAQLAFTDMQQMSADLLLNRVDMMLEYLCMEYERLDKEYRYVPQSRAGGQA